MELNEKVALVTGGGRGIGRACCLALAEAGAAVAINYSSSKDAAEAVKAEIEKAGGRAETYQADVSSFEEVEQMFERLKADFGRLDILVNNAGVIRDTLLLRMKPADWEKVIGVSLNGAFHCTKLAAEIMMRARSGRVINIASVIGVMGGAGQANYAAAKAGLISFTRACAAEMSGRGLRFNSVLPGMIETDMSETVRKHASEKIMERIPAKRFGQPEDVARVVVFLASPAADYINGEAITVDGGMHVG
ncbi:MAG: 3-oxoacyl-[acyl-carrier-protein] reductase [bacterium]|nr:3-oxoacyl-[acyl-carrier-protein] reductase [bacterium]